MNVAQEFELLYRAAGALDLRGDASEAALVTITRTQGSTFRRAGTSMLVHRDGTLVCELSGGCPQRDIVLRAHRAMAHGEPALVSYGRDNNYDVMLETGCGGELEVLIEPWRQPSDIEFLHAIERLRAKRVPGVMASLFAADGDAPPRPPLRVVRGNGNAWTNIQDDTLKACVLACMAAQSPTSSTAVSTELEHAGHHHDVLLESLHPPHALVIIGDSVSAHMLATLSHQLGWHTTLVSMGNTENAIPAGVLHVEALPHSLASVLAFDNQTSAVVMTHRLERDLAYATALMATPVRYIGVMGSRQRAGQIRAIFPEDHRLHAPAGLDVGSETPQEIALAIAAEILALRNGRRGGPLTHSQAPIHP